jgi:peptidyl-prolyl cis-trans isomerase C
MKYLVLLLGASFAWGQQTPPPADPVVLTIGAEKLTKSQFEQIIDSLPDQEKAQAQSPAGKRVLAERLSELKSLAQEARQRKLDQSPKVQTQLALQTDQLLARMVYQEFGNSTKPDDAALHEFYNKHKQEWEEVKARHILIRTQGSQVPLKPGQKDLTDSEALAKAKEIREKIVGGADFAKMATDESFDVGTAANGGQLGAFGKNSGMVPAFQQAAFALEPGKVSEPVKTQFGYHLILVESHATKPFEEVKPEIEQKIKPEMAQKGLEELKKKTNVVYNEGYFGK